MWYSHSLSPTLTKGCECHPNLTCFSSQRRRITNFLLQWTSWTSSAYSISGLIWWLRFSLPIFLQPWCQVTLSISSLSAGHAISRVAEGGQVSTSFKTTSLFILPESLPLCCLKACSLGFRRLVAVWSGIRINDTSVKDAGHILCKWLTLTFDVSTILMSLESIHQLLGVVARRNQPVTAAASSMGHFHYCRYYKDCNQQHYARDRWHRWLLNENFESLGRWDLDCRPSLQLDVLVDEIIPPTCRKPTGQDYAPRQWFLFKTLKAVFVRRDAGAEEEECPSNFSITKEVAIQSHLRPRAVALHAAEKKIKRYVCSILFIFNIQHSKD